MPGRRNNVIIAAGYSRAKKLNERDAAVAAFADMVARAREADSCLDVATSADSVNPACINVLECCRKAGRSFD
jgi:alkylhydroperoxidase family enzyme